MPSKVRTPEQRVECVRSGGRCGETRQEMGNSGTCCSDSYKLRCMKRFLTAVAVTVVAPLMVWGQGFDELPYIGVKSDASGRYGYFDGDGNNVIPCVYDSAVSFSKGKCVTSVSLGGKYFLIDRSGRMVLDRGFDTAAEVAGVVAEVGDKGNRFIIDFAGRRLSPEGWNFKVVCNSQDLRDVGAPVLFSMGRVGDDKIYLTDWSFGPLSNVPASDFFYDNRAAYALRYRVVSGYLEKCGLMNCDGDVTVPAEGSMTVYSLADSYIASTLGKSGVLAGYGDSDMRSTFFVDSYDGGVNKVYAITGELLAKEPKAKSVTKMLRANIKSVGSYLRSREENTERYMSVYMDPYRRRCAVALNSEMYRGAVAAADSIARAVVEGSSAGAAAPAGERSVSAVKPLSPAGSVPAAKSSVGISAASAVEASNGIQKSASGDDSGGDSDEDDVEDDGDWSGDFIAGFIDAAGGSGSGSGSVSGQKAGAGRRDPQAKGGKLPKEGTIIDSFNAVYVRSGKKIVVSTAIVDGRPYLVVNDGYPAFMSDGTVGKSGEYFVFRSKMDASEKVLVSLNWHIVFFEGEGYSFPRVIAGSDGE